MDAYPISLGNFFSSSSQSSSRSLPLGYSTQLCDKSSNKSVSSNIINFRRKPTDLGKDWGPHVGQGDVS